LVLAGSGRLGIPVMLNAPYTHKEIGEVAARHPRLRIILDHLGARTLQKDDALRPQIESTARLAEHPNIHVKLTLVPVFSTAPYPYKNIQPSIHRLLEAYGPRRCFWGTDASAMLQRTSCSYAGCAVHRAHGFHVQDGPEWVMGRGLAECLDWPKRT
jgi:predicted TIM-barrel fold metal-dependent hydrolase